MENPSETQRITRGIGWANMPTILKAMRFCPSWKSCKSWNLDRSPQHAPLEQQLPQPQQTDQLQPHSEQFRHPPQLPKTWPYQIVHMGRSHSLERHSPKSLLRTPSLPSLSPSPSPELFPELIPIEIEAAVADSTPKLSRRKAKVTNPENLDLTNEQCRKAAALCTVGPESIADHQVRRSLRPLLDLERINQKRTCNPVNCRSAAMVATFVRSAGDRTRGVWKFLNTVCQTDTGMKLAELEHSFLKRCLLFFSGMVLILVHPSFYKSLKVRFPLDVGGITRDDRVTTELGTGSLRQAVGILTPKDFWPIVASE